MPLSNNIGTYADLRPILRSAIDAGGAIFRPRNSRGVSSPGYALHTAQRIGKFRSLLNLHSDPLGQELSEWTFTVENDAIIIAPRTYELTTLEGNPLQPTKEAPAENPEIVRLRQELFGDED